MKNLITLNRLKENHCAVIDYIPESCNIYRRLCDFGVNCGTTVKCVKRRKGIGAYCIKETVVAIRDVDAQKIVLLLKKEVE